MRMTKEMKRQMTTMMNEMMSTMCECSYGMMCMRSLPASGCPGLKRN